MRENRLRFCVETVNTSKAYTLTRLNTKQSVNLLGFGTMKPSDDPGVSKNEFNSRMRWMQSELDNFANEVCVRERGRGGGERERGVCEREVCECERERCVCDRERCECVCVCVCVCV